jgi:hypothetical protein
MSWPASRSAMRVAGAPISSSSGCGAACRTSIGRPCIRPLRRLVLAGRSGPQPGPAFHGPRQVPTDGQPRRNALGAADGRVVPAEEREQSQAQQRPGHKRGRRLPSGAKVRRHSQRKEGHEDQDERLAGKSEGPAFALGCLLRLRQPWCSRSFSRRIFSASRSSEASVCGRTASPLRTTWGCAARNAPTGARSRPRASRPWADPRRRVPGRVHVEDAMDVVWEGASSKLTPKEHACVYAEAPRRARRRSPERRGSTPLTSPGFAR